MIFLCTFTLQYDSQKRKRKAGEFSWVTIVDKRMSVVFISVCEQATDIYLELSNKCPVYYHVDLWTYFHLPHKSQKKDILVKMELNTARS